MGTATKYHVQRFDKEIKKIGILNLAGTNDNITISPQISYLTDSTIKNTINDFNDFKFQILDISQIDTSQKNPGDVCIKNNLDGLVVIEVQFIELNLSLALISIGKEMHSQAQLNLYSDKGTKLLQISHRTTSDPYGTVTPEKTSNDAITLALKKLISETKRMNERI